MKQSSAKANCVRTLRDAQQIERCSSRGTKLSGLDLLLRPLAVLHPTLGFGDRRPKGRVDAPRWRRGDQLGREEAVEIHLSSGALEKRANGGGVKRSGLKAPRMWPERGRSLGVVDLCTVFTPLRFIPAGERCKRELAK